jgi:hypothetical protein
MSLMLMLALVPPASFSKRGNQHVLYHGGYFLRRW